MSIVVGKEGGGGGRGVVCCVIGRHCRAEGFQPCGGGGGACWRWGTEKGTGQGIGKCSG